MSGSKDTAEELNEGSDVDIKSSATSIMQVGDKESNSGAWHYVYMLSHMYTESAKLFFAQF